MLLFAKFNIVRRFLPLPQLNLDPKTSVTALTYPALIYNADVLGSMLNTAFGGWAGMLIINGQAHNFSTFIIQ